MQFRGQPIQPRCGGLSTVLPSLFDQLVKLRLKLPGINAELRQKPAQRLKLRPRQQVGQSGQVIPPDCAARRILIPRLCKDVERLSWWLETKQ